MCSATLEEDLSVRDIYENEYYIVEQALNRLEAIDNSNPSEALRCLHWMGEHRIEFGEFLSPIKDISEFRTIQNALLKAQKEHKALEIIKEKEVNMQVFNQCEDVETYNKVYIKQKDRQLTQEEFNLLKEAPGC